MSPPRPKARRSLASVVPDRCTGDDADGNCRKDGQRKDFEPARQRFENDADCYADQSREAEGDGNGV